MLSDKEQKKRFKKIASENPEQYYPTTVLKKEGFQRKQCTKCGLFFWTVNKDQLAKSVCGDSVCSGGFRFYNDNPSIGPLKYTDVWKRFSRMFSQLGYAPIARYPVVARWNPTAEFTIASIAAFQPHVVSGESEPPAKKLVIPQFSIRFVDIDNVGITGSHMTGFVMIGQHQFVTKEEWDQAAAFTHILTWLREGMGLPNEEITFHEDAWAGGGNFGPCMEFFSRGVEIGNQVYMLYEQTEGGERELKIKVLDMGMGQERVAWFTQGAPTIYDATFPEVMKKLRQKANIHVNELLMKKFVPFAGYLNVDEVADINKAWEEVAKKINEHPKTLRENILPSAALYSIGEHCRTLLFALNDGALPSNAGGGYNLRLLIRRCLGFIDHYQWNIYLPDVCAWHAAELKEQFPELSEKLDNIKKILDVEKERYQSTRQKSQQIIAQILQKGKAITENVLIELYDSQGITPELIREEAQKQGITVIVPDNFYGRVAERHEKKEQIHATKRDVEISLKTIPETEALYYDDYTMHSFDAKVVHQEGKLVLLDKSYFYPTSGGQVHDTGTIEEIPIVDVFKHGASIVHVLEYPRTLPHSVHCSIDKERREQLAQHHTATHIVNAAARTVLGPHINQAGAKKTVEKAHIDITHYQSLSPEEIAAIEREANVIVKKKIATKLRFMQRNEAEKKYGMAIYQGGAVPGKLLRIVEIPGIDVECCGGTHLHNTAEAGKIKILKASKIQDGVVRLEFVAGPAAEQLHQSESEVLVNLANTLAVKKEELPARVVELFTKWKKSKKLLEKLEKGTAPTKDEIKELELSVREKFSSKDEGEIIVKLAQILKTQEEHIVKTATRFLQELEQHRKKLKEVM